jgi:hypothetical protein
MKMRGGLDQNKRLLRVMLIGERGFSLIMVSILLTVAALIFVSVLPGQEAGDANQKTLNSITKLERIEEATRSFMAFHGRRPCPADGQYVENTANFGLEAATPGTCTGGTPSAPLGPDIGTGYIVGGTIPTRSLGLPDEYAYDDFGRQFTYVVDIRATSLSACRALEGLRCSAAVFLPKPRPAQKMLARRRRSNVALEHEPGLFRN